MWSAKKRCFRGNNLLFSAGIIFSLFLISGGIELLSARFNNPELNRTLRWMVFYPIYTFPAMIIGSVLVIKDKVNINVIYNITTAITLTLLIIAATMITQSYEAPLLVRIFLPILFLPITICLCFKYLPGKIDKPRLVSMINILKFAVPLGLANVFESLSLQLSNIIVSILCSPEEFAIYANGAREIPLIGVITSSITVIIMAEMSEKCKLGDRKAALELFRKAATSSACFLLPALFFLMFFADDFIKIMFTDKYSGSTLPFRIYLLLLPARIVIYRAAFIALGQSKKNLYRSIFYLLISLIVSYFFVSVWGMYGSAIAIVGTMYIWAIPYNWYILSKEFACQFTYILPMKRIGVITLLSLLIALIASSFLLINMAPLFHFLSGSLCFCSLYIFVFL
ncbi:MAG: oligosaccharide flippase family protein [Tannerellaceae bacterium]|nr:oligosaccharide flippase family protein [Tannerellaceae bacterium]